MENHNVGDVIGAPESWRNLLNDHARRMPNMRGALISEIDQDNEGFAIGTRGGECGETYSVFRISEPGLRRRLLAVLMVGMDVHRAVKLAI